MGNCEEKKNTTKIKADALSEVDSLKQHIPEPKHLRLTNQTFFAELT
jgi:hypothetical protein